MTEINVFSNPLELIRNKPEMFFYNVPILQGELVFLVWNDIQEAGAREVDIKCRGRSVFINSDVDWMDVPGVSIEELFSRFTTPRAEKPNTHRSEILLSAVCDSIVTDGAAGNFSNSKGRFDSGIVDMAKGNVKKRYLMFNIHNEESKVL